MKRFLKRLGFHSPDEMEKAILFKAQRNAYIFLVISLVSWSLYESYKVYVYHTNLNLIPCMLLVTAAIVQSFSQLIMTRNVVKDDEDSYETAPLFKIIILICVVASVMATVTAAIIFMSIKL